MRTSILTSGMADKFLRMCRLVLPAILVLGATAAAAQMGGTLGQPLNSGQPQNSLTGQWRGVYNGITITVVIEPTGQYTQTAQSGTLMTLQSGPYKLVAPNTIIFCVTSWQPRTMPVYHPTGTVGGYYTQEPMAKPPDVTNTYVFKAANTVVFTEPATHGSITMTRVP
jgi:hypothetical protein